MQLLIKGSLDLLITSNLEGAHDPISPRSSCTPLKTPVLHLMDNKAWLHLDEADAARLFFSQPRR